MKGEKKCWFTKNFSLYATRHKTLLDHFNVRLFRAVGRSTLMEGDLVYVLEARKDLQTMLPRAERDGAILERRHLAVESSSYWTVIRPNRKDLHAKRRSTKSRTLSSLFQTPTIGKIFFGLAHLKRVL